MLLVEKTGCDDQAITFEALTRRRDGEKNVCTSSLEDGKGGERKSMRVRIQER